MPTYAEAVRAYCEARVKYDGERWRTVAGTVGPLASREAIKLRGRLYDVQHPEELLKVRELAAAVEVAEAELIQATHQAILDVADRLQRP